MFAYFHICILLRQFDGTIFEVCHQKVGKPNYSYILNHNFSKLFIFVYFHMHIFLLFDRLIFIPVIALFNLNLCTTTPTTFY